MPGRLSAWGALLGLLVGGFALGPGVATAECRLATIADFHADVSGGSPIIDGAVDGQPIKILVDTGSDRTMITAAAAKRLGLINTAPVGGAYAIGGLDQVSLATIKDLTIDRFELSNIVLDTVGDPRQSAPFDMVLGDDILSHYDVEFDLANGAIRLFDSQGCEPPQLVYWAKPYAQAALLPVPRGDAKITATVELNGERTVAELDTGARESIVDLTVALGAGVERGSPGSEAGGAVAGFGGAEDTFTGTFKSFVFGDEKLANAKLHVAKLASRFQVTPTGSKLARPVDGVPQMLIGDDFFHAHHVMVANHEHAILFSYSGGPVFTVAAINDGSQMVRDRLAAAKGDAAAQLDVGRRYHRGQGVTRDDAEALRWFELAATQGNTNAETEIGLIYEQGGPGVKADDTQARIWIAEAAAQGDAQARQWMAAHPAAGARTP